MIDPGRLFPHKTVGDLDLRLDDLSVGLPNGKRLPIKGRAAVVLHSNEYGLYADQDLNDWVDLRASVRVLAQDEMLRGVLPNGSDPASDAAMVVSVSCVATRLRRRVFLTADRDRPGEWYGQIDVRASDLADVVEFSPVLTRSSNLPQDTQDDEGTPLATYRGAILGVGDTLRIRVDAPKERSGSFKVRWEHFSTSTNPWRRDHPKEMFYIDTSEETPEVVLNSSHELLKQTLMKKRSRGPEAAIKHAVIAYVAHTTWVSLFLAALAGCASGGEEDVAWPTDEIKTKVLKRMLPLVVSERTDPLERLEAAVEFYRDPSRFSTLLTKLHSAVQAVLKIDDFVVKTLEATSEEVS